MLTIGLTGDTHGDRAALEKLAAVRSCVAEWLHTGDFYRDAATLAELSGFTVTAVAGNNDFFMQGPYDYNKMLARQGYKIWLTHGHKHGGRLLAENQRMNADIVVYGHTHVPDISWQEGVLFINPGSPAFPRRSSPKGYVLLSLAAGKAPEARFVPLGD